MKKAIYPGSFDPITFGHIDIIRRVASIYGEVIVLVSNSISKSYLFSEDERLDQVKKCLSEINNVKVEVHSGLTVDFAKNIGAQVIIRGLRALSDFENEVAMANVNKKLAPEIETMIMFASDEYSYIASRLVKEVAKNAGDVSAFVPPTVANALQKKFSK